MSIVEQAIALNPGRTLHLSIQPISAHIAQIDDSDNVDLACCFQFNVQDYPTAEPAIIRPDMSEIVHVLVDPMGSTSFHHNRRPGQASLQFDLPFSRHL